MSLIARLAEGGEMGQMLRDERKLTLTGSMISHDQSSRSSKRIESTWPAERIPIAGLNTVPALPNGISQT